MQLIYKENKDEKITRTKNVIFTAKTSGIYLIEITARVKNSKQLSSTDDEDLKVEINNKKFPFNTPAAFSGSDQKGLKKTIYFIIPLDSGKNEIVLIPDISAIITNLNIYKIDIDSGKLDLVVNDQAEDGDRRPWIIITLIDVGLSNFTVNLKLARRFIDSDDIKIIIDGQVKRNARSILHKYWYFIASLITGVIQTEAFTTNLLPGTHHLEFWADRMPTIQNIKLDLGKSRQKNIPTVDNPRWTGDFADDTDQMILARAIFGEARSQQYPDKARIAVGWSIRNRVDDSRWPNTYQGVVTQPLQYSAFNQDDPNREYVENPLHIQNKSNNDAWYNCYEIAGKIISANLKDPTDGANHYYDNSIPAPYWTTKETKVLTVENSDKTAALIFHKL